MTAVYDTEAALADTASEVARWLEAAAERYHYARTDAEREAVLREARPMHAFKVRLELRSAA